MRRLGAVIEVLVLLASALVAVGAPAPAVATASRCTIRGTSGDDVLRGTPGPDRICGRGGDDRLRGMGGDDVLRGGRGNDTMLPGTGSNTVAGGDGTDTVSYENLATGAVAVNLDAGFAAGAVTDTLALVENAIGTARPDRLVGSAGKNRLEGRGGADVIVGGWGSDVLLGGAGEDSIAPDRGDDVVGGGPGTDLVTYADLAGLGVSIDLVEDRATGTASGADDLFSIEDAIGSPAGDLIRGTDGDNLLDGRDGVDRILPGRGDDEIFGGGNHGGREGEGIADTVDYSTVTTGVVVDLANGTVSGPGSSTIDGIINVIGSDASDVLVAGGNPWTVLRGGDGDDLVEGPAVCGGFAGGAGDDVIAPGTGGGCGDVVQYVDGGSGSDTVTYAGTSGPLWVEAEFNRNWYVGQTYPDAIVGEVETFIASDAADHLHGGLGATNVTFVGGGGADDIDTTDGVGGDTIQAGPEATCVGDPGDTVSC